MYTVLFLGLFTQHCRKSFFTFQTIISESSFQAALGLQLVQMDEKGRSDRCLLLTLSDCGPLCSYSSALGTNGAERPQLTAWTEHFCSYHRPHEPP